MLYRFFRGLVELYGAVALAAFIALFFIAFAFTVLYPIVPIVLIMVAPFAAVTAVGGSRLLRMVERFFARKKLAMARCPQCEGGLEERQLLDPESDDHAEATCLVCEQCQRAFIVSGRCFPLKVQTASSSPDQFAD